MHTLVTLNKGPAGVPLTSGASSITAPFSGTSSMCGLLGPGCEDLSTLFVGCVDRRKALEACLVYV